MNPTKCNQCGADLKIIETPNTIHFGMLRCITQNHFNGWARNPDSKNYESKRIGNRANIRHVAQFHKMNQDNLICFFCLRTKDQLGLSETLTVDHIRELNTAAEGEDFDQVHNMQILCSSCHKLKNWARLYMNWHFNKKGGVQ